ncbi:hypothetical protein E2C01_043109 [Portunus trituberculatus]|uniref:Uncharacterized protein n=1 Tax=Portunus trituberculatus TaxID=210409 RepID=A0A5B7FS18_PORTR|nr:hypothetical protein [Portunus trituberculatus]
METKIGSYLFHNIGHCHLKQRSEEGYTGVLTPQSGANPHSEWILFLHFHFVSYIMASKLPSEETDSKKSSKTVTIEIKLEVLDPYVRGKDLSDCPCNGIDGEHIAYY